MLIMIVLIRKEDFDRVQERLCGHQATRPEADRRPLVGLVRCGSCGPPLVSQSTRGGHRYYRCPFAMLGIFDAAFCSKRPIRTDVLDTVVRKVISAPPFDDEAGGGPAGGSS